MSYQMKYPVYSRLCGRMPAARNTLNRSMWVGWVPRRNVSLMYIQPNRHVKSIAIADKVCGFMDSRLRRFPPCTSCNTWTSHGKRKNCFPQLAHTSAAAHKLHRPQPTNDKKTLHINVESPHLRAMTCPCSSTASPSKSAHTSRPRTNTYAGAKKHCWTTTPKSFAKGSEGLTSILKHSSSYNSFSASIFSNSSSMPVYLHCSSC
jgi:hypothetical protein